MSNEPPSVSALELTRRAYESGEGGDFDAMMSFYSADCVWDVSSWGLGTHTGLVRVRHFLEDWIGSFVEYELEVEAMREVGNGVVYVVATQHARPRSSRARLHLRSGSVFVWVGEEAVRVTHYRDLREARSAAELLAFSRTPEPAA
jgi:ketosteroid isomerase-like protein